LVDAAEIFNDFVDNVKLGRINNKILFLKQIKHYFFNKNN
jgi:hypothetical protein